MTLRKFVIPGLLASLATATFAEPGYLIAQIDISDHEAFFMTTTEVPKLAFAVTPGGLAPPPVVAWWKENLSNLTVVDLGPGAHFIQEDYPDAIGQNLKAWIQTL